jgi:long-chain acyl-CoA synthetase
MVPNVFAFPVAMLGIHRAGAAQVNVNPLYTPHELQHQLRDAGAEIIIIFTGSTSTLAEIVADSPVKTVITVALGDAAGVAIPTPPILCVNPMSVTEFTETCGLPVPSTDIKLLDGDGGEVPGDEAGEISAKGPQVMRGYWNNDAANASAFTPDGYFKTGDVGIFTAGGFLKIVDRKKDMVIVSGFNVYPNEVEAVVTACHGVVECACIGVPDPKTGEAVRVYVVTAPFAEVTSEEIIAHCRKDLAAYKVPKQIYFVDALPKSSVGKILRRDLRKMAVA